MTRNAFIGKISNAQAPARFRHRPRGGLAACGESSRQVIDGTGPSPKLPKPNKTLIPTVNIAPAVGWPAGGKPTAAAGTQVAAFAEGLDHPRWLYVLPNGDVLVAETNAPPKPDDSKGVRGWVMEKVMGKAGAGVPSPNRITLLRDADHVAWPKRARYSCRISIHRSV